MGQATKTAFGPPTPRTILLQFFMENVHKKPSIKVKICSIIFWIENDCGERGVPLFALTREKHQNRGEVVGQNKWPILNCFQQRELMME